MADVLSNPVRVSVGELGAANEDVTQHVEVLEGGDGAKRAWLMGRMQVGGHGCAFKRVGVACNCGLF